MNFIRQRIMRIAAVSLGAYLTAIAMLVLSGVSDDVRKADVALVLGNKVNPDGSLSPRLEARLRETLRRYKEGCFRLIVVSGATGREGYDEALAMKRYLLAHDVPLDAIVCDSAGVNTYASARNIRDILSQRSLKSVFVITQYFHVPRARLALHRFGVENVSSSHARYFEWRDLFSVQREVFGYARYATRNYR